MHFNLISGEEVSIIPRVSFSCKFYCLDELFKSIIKGFSSHKLKNLSCAKGHINEARVRISGIDKQFSILTLIDSCTYYIMYAYVYQCNFQV